MSVPELKQLADEVRWQARAVSRHRFLLLKCAQLWSGAKAASDRCWMPSRSQEDISAAGLSCSSDSVPFLAEGGGLSH